MYDYDESMLNWIEINMYGSITSSSIRINLDNYNSKLLDMLYIPQIKKILEEMIEKELEKAKNEED